MALPTPEGPQQAFYYDSKVRALTVAVSPAGAKTFWLYRRINGRPGRVRIGLFPDLSVDQARGIAEQKNADIAQGKDIVAERRAFRNEETLQELFDSYLERHAKVFKRTWTDDVSMFNQLPPSWRNRKISEIRRNDVIALHAKIGSTRGKFAANRTIELLSSMFNKQISWGWEGINPAAKVQAFPEKKRERYMSDDELSAFFLSLGQEPNHTVRDYLWISILTGARRSNVESMRWAEISWSTATWTIPAEKSKSGEAMTLPLIPKAVEILRARRESSTEESSAISPAPVKLGRKVENASQWVFPGVGATGHLVEPKTAWKRILSRASDLQLKEWLDANPRKTAADFVKHNPSAGAIRDVRLHDLRRTLGSKMAALGVSLPIIGKALGHRSLSATQIYSRVNLDAVRQGVTIATDAMLKLSGGVPLLGDGN